MDDILVASRVLCTHCLRHIEKKTYSGTLVFDIDESATTRGGDTYTAKFLDLWLLWCNGTVTIMQHIRNIEMILHGDPKAIVKQKKQQQQIPAILWPDTGRPKG